MTEDHDEQLAQQWYDDKTSMMVNVLGEEHDIVMHAIIPYAVGGGLDLYYFPHGIAGTAIATKELCEVPGEGSSNNVFGTYELGTCYRLMMPGIKLRRLAARITPLTRFSTASLPTANRQH